MEAKIALRRENDLDTIMKNRFMHEIVVDIERCNFYKFHSEKLIYIVYFLYFCSYQQTQTTATNYKFMQIPLFPIINSDTQGETC